MQLLRFARNPAIRMFETEIQKDAFFTATGAHAHWERNSRDNLQAAGEVVGPTDTGIQQQLAPPLGLSLPHNCLPSIESRFK